MEETDQNNVDNEMDFESGIDTWIIDKEESNGSLSSNDNTGKEPNVHSLEFKAMDKENINQFSSLADKKSLRSFRIRKHVSYQELSSESESDCKRKSSNDNDTYSFWSKKPKVEPSQTSLHCGSSTPQSSESENKKETLDSQKIMAILSEAEGSSDSIQETNRERLHSIENVNSGFGDSKEKNEDTLPRSLVLICPTCNGVCKNLEELKSHENMHRKANLAISNQESSPKPQTAVQTDTSFLSNRRAFNWNKTDFLDTFKSHLISRGTLAVDNTRIKSSIKETSGDVTKFTEEISTDTKSFKCNICNYYTSELLVYKSHEILFHSEKNMLDCEYCDYRTTQRANLATHIRVHFQLDCPHCEYQCSLKSSLETHLMKHHQGNNYYKCKTCDYGCKSESKLKKHLELHSAMTKYQCGECNLFFPTKQTLSIHIRKHSFSKRSFKCNKCELSFSQKHVLKLHMKSHEQSYICDTCNSTFSKKQWLKVHMKVHTPEYIKCEKCDSTFTRKNYLKLHMRIHVPKCFKCQHCSFRCTNPNELSKHICINKLYEVQKRSLNFQKEEIKNNTVPNEENTRGKLSLESSEPVEKTKNKHKLKNENKIGKIISGKTLFRKKKYKKNNYKLLSLRQNLRSHRNQRTKTEDERKCDEILKGPKKFTITNITSDNANPDMKSTHKTIKNSTYKANLKQNTWVMENSTTIIDKKKLNLMKKIKKEQNLVSLNCAKILFNKSPKILVEPIRFSNASYVQCYYQTQQPSTTEDLLERHLRQSTLFSCRFCKYKTNSDQLLKNHTAKNHTWDPAVVNTLFS